MKVNKKEVESFQDYDVIVAGGGPAGTMAAIAAARNGAKTLLVERYGFLGGMATNALVGPLQSFHAGQEQIVLGLAQEMIDRLIAIDGTPGHVPDMIGFVSTVTPVDVEKMKYILQEMCEESGVELLLHTVVSGVSKNNEGLIECLDLFNKSGHFYVKAPIYIDCTGDGDVLAMAGVPFEKGRKKDGLAQPMTMMFRMGEVDLRQVREYMLMHPEEFVLADGWETYSNIAVSGFFSLVKKAKEDQKLSIERDRVLFFELPIPGEVTVNMTRVIRFDATDGKALARAEVLGRQQVMQAVSFLKEYIPGFSKAKLITCGTQIGVRESRRIVGEYILIGEDVVKGKKFDDVIARGSYPIDIHSPDGDELNVIVMEPGTSYDIPYRSVLNSTVPNLLVAGRCLSATHEALASARVTPTAMAVGQAVGTAGAIASQHKIAPSQIDISDLQKRLDEQGCNLGLNIPR
jgi:hypothetical protein